METEYRNTVPDAVLTQRSGEDGFTKSEIVEMLDKLVLSPDEEVDAIYLEGVSAIAFGFIRMAISEEKLSFETGQQSDFGRQALTVVNDVTMESEDCRYRFAGVDTLMYY